AQETGDHRVLAAWWCRSVGTSWTVELRAADRTLGGRPLEWICSGIPTQQPAPDQLITDLFRDHGLLLFPDDPVKSGTRSRWLIGFVTRDPEVMRLALTLRCTREEHTRAPGGEHPLLIAARLIRGKCSNARAGGAWQGLTRGLTRPLRAGLTRREVHTVGTDDKIENQAEVLKGKVKETAGRVGDDPEMEAEGRGDQAKGHVKQAGEKAKDA